MTPPAQRHSVLVVEDDPATAELERRVLVRAGTTVSVVGSVTEALAAIEKGSYEAVLLDHSLPDGDPWAVVGAAHAKSPRIPVIIVTAQGNERIASEALRRGVADYQKKSDALWGQLPGIVDRVTRFARVDAELAAKNLELARSHRELEQRTVELRLSEERLRRLYVKTPALMHSVDRKGRILTISDALLGKLGYAREEVLGRTTLEFLTPASREYALKEVLPVFFETGHYEDIAYQVVAKDGSIIDVLLSGDLERDEEGRIQRSLEVLEDVTAKNALQRQLAEKRQRLAYIIESTHAGTWEWNVQTNEAHFNERWAGIIGQTLAALSPLSVQAWLDNTHPEDLLRSARLLEAHFSNQSERYECEVRMRHREGHWVWILARGRLMTRTPDGKPEWMFGTHEDISERIAETQALEAAQRTLQDKEAQLRTLLRTIPDIVWFKDTEGVYRACNSSFERCYCLTEKEVIGKSDFDLAPKELAEAFRDEDRRVHETGRPTSHERRQEFPASGQVLWLEVTKVPLYDGAGKIAGVLGIGHDITERKKSSAALESARQAAEAANQAKSQFLAAMSHEIRTPLNGILGMAQLLMMDRIDESRRKEYLCTIFNSGRTLLAVLNDVLDLSKIEAGRMELDDQGFDPAALVSEIAMLFQEPAREKGLSLSQEWQGAPCRLLGDPIRLRQMLTNYVSNAVKFSSHGEVRITASVSGPAVARDDGTPQVIVEFAVEDQGIGLDADAQARLFQPFSQVDGLATRRFGGTGLGLSIVRGLAEQMGGSVGVTSQPGRGARFWFRARAGLQAVVNRARRQEPAGPSTEQSEHSPLFERALALVVEDNATNRLVVSSMLERLGFATREAQTGQECLDLLAAWEGEPPALVLMDVQMPVLDGISTTRAIRQREAATGARPLPIVALTAAAFPEDERRCREAGMNGFLSKPIDYAEFEKAVRAAVSRGAKREQPDAPGAGPAATSDVAAVPVAAARAPEVPALDREGALRRFAGDRALLERLLRSLCGEIPQALDGLMDARMRGDAAAAASLAHRLRGSAGQLSALATQRAAAALEVAARDAPAVVWAPLVHGLEKELRRLREEVPDDPLPGTEPAVVPAAAASLGATLATLRRLQEQLRRSSLSARPQLGRLKELLGPDPLLLAIEGRLAVLDFRGALGHSEELAVRLLG